MSIGPQQSPFSPKGSSKKLSKGKRTTTGESHKTNNTGFKKIPDTAPPILDSCSSPIIHPRQKRIKQELIPSLDTSFENVRVSDEKKVSQRSFEEPLIYEAQHVPLELCIPEDIPPLPSEHYEKEPYSEFSIIRDKLFEEFPAIYSKKSTLFKNFRAPAMQLFKLFQVYLDQYHSERTTQPLLLFKPFEKLNSQLISLYPVLNKSTYEDMKTDILSIIKSPLPCTSDTLKFTSFKKIPNRIKEKYSLIDSETYKIFLDNIRVCVIDTIQQALITNLSHALEQIPQKKDALLKPLIVHMNTLLNPSTTAFDLLISPEMVSQPAKITYLDYFIHHALIELNDSRNQIPRVPTIPRITPTTVASSITPILPPTTGNTPTDLILDMDLINISTSAPKGKKTIEEFSSQLPLETGFLGSTRSNSHTSKKGGSYTNKTTTLVTSDTSSYESYQNFQQNPHTFNLSNTNPLTYIQTDKGVYILTNRYEMPNEAYPQKTDAKGGFGRIKTIVMRGEDNRYHHCVVKKIVSPTTNETMKKYQEQLKQYNEARIIKYLPESNHIIKIIDAGAIELTYMFKTKNHGDNLFIIMEAATPLEQISEKIQVGVNSPSRTLHILYQVYQGLKALHEHGIIHKDLKIDNLLIGQDGYIKLSDFGTCHMEEWEEMNVYSTTRRIDLPSNQIYDKRYDISTLGILALELFSGEKMMPIDNFSPQNLAQVERILEQINIFKSSDSLIEAKSSKWLRKLIKGLRFPVTNGKPSHIEINDPRVDYYERSLRLLEEIFFKLNEYIPLDRPLFKAHSPELTFIHPDQVEALHWMHPFLQTL